MKNGFFAYPTNPTSCEHAIEKFITEINARGIDVEIKSWRALSIGGNVIISNILNEIDKADFFCADITYSNENVLFELGFAIGKRKPVWLIQDTSITGGMAKFKELDFLTSVGHIAYTSARDILDAFEKERPDQKKGTIADTIINVPEKSGDNYSLLYLKSQYSTDFNQYVEDIIKSFRLPCIVDDATENRVQSLSWYISRLKSVPAVLAEFSALNRGGAELQNAKCGFLAGLGLGMGLKVQMIAAKPYPTTFDYQEYLKKFTNTELLREAVYPFIEDLKSNIAVLINKQSTTPNVRRVSSPLEGVRFGENIAEHESSSIFSYYVNSSHEDDILKSEYNLVVGRKGSGKTATLYFLEALLGQDVRNIVVPIKPVNFEIDGLIQLIKSLTGEFERGYIIPAIWKFLLYGEVAKTLYSTIVTKPEYAKTQLDRKMALYIGSNSQFLLTDISTRLEQVISKMDKLSETSEQSKFRERVSEVLHDQVIGELKNLIIEYMTGRNKLVVIIDNLDKTWQKGKDIETTSRFLLGLLGVIGRIAKELKGNPNKPNDFSLNLVVLLRSDIFNYIQKYSREPDKLEVTRLRWDDMEVMFRLIDRRIEELSDKKMNQADKFWSDRIVSHVDGIETKKFIWTCILPRPRDLIFFLNAAKNRAVLRGHATIEQADIHSAYADYSNWVFKSILVENGISIAQMEAFLLCLIGEDSVQTRASIESFMTTAQIDQSIASVDYFIDFLCSLSFIGRETSVGRFEYENDFDEDVKIKILSNKLGSNRYKIHNAFIPFLESKDYYS